MQLALAETTTNDVGAVVDAINTKRDGGRSLRCPFINVDGAACERVGGLGREKGGAMTRVSRRATCYPHLFLVEHIVRQTEMFKTIRDWQHSRPNPNERVGLLDCTNIT